MDYPQDTIVAQATAVGKGGVGIVRVSGAQAKTVAEAILGKCPAPRRADYLPFRDANGSVLDQGIGLFFEGPNSFTGEDVLELQGHGGQVVMDLLIQACLQINNVRSAKPGEFSERAFLNDKMDLAQAEAIADLIDASSEQAARSALRSLQGEFSNAIHGLVEQVIHLRMYVEAAIDFPDEEVDFLSDGKIQADLNAIIEQLQTVKRQARQGSLLREGMRVVIAGKPNAGKSSLLNALAGKESAIVTDVAGTTRDVLREHIHIDGMPLHVIDTAGLRDSPDKVEQIGIARAREEIQQADRLLVMVDSHEASPTLTVQQLLKGVPKSIGVTIIYNKIDQTEIPPDYTQLGDYPEIKLSAKTGEGVDLLKGHLKALVGFEANGEGQYSARRRHLEAIDKAENHLNQGKYQLEENLAGDLLAEELRLCQQYLNEITGEFSSDDLLGRIFSSFCIGK